MRSSTTDFGAGLFSLLVAAIFYAHTGSLHDVGLLYSELLIGFITLGGVYLLGLGLHKRKKESAQSGGAGPDQEPVALKRVALISGLSIAYALLMGLLGFYSASILFLFGSAMLLNDMGLGMGRAVFAACTLPLIMCLAVWLGFGMLLRVPTPEGLLF